MGGRCCVFQPFDGGPYDKRYEDVLIPAITAANLEPYRVDRDSAATIPMDTLHQAIKLSTACVADITTNNPNVWYELGYAIAINKPTVMICAKGSKLPFDIQHRRVIYYSPDSPRDFEKLRLDITNSLNSALQQREEAASALTPVRETEGLRQHEISALAMVMAIRESPKGGASVYEIREQMSEIFTDVAIKLAQTSLSHQKLIELGEEEDGNGNTYTAWYLTPQGEKWLLDHQDKLQLVKDPKPKSQW
jgi:hypothetical protein